MNTDEVRQKKEAYVKLRAEMNSIRSSGIPSQHPCMTLLVLAVILPFSIYAAGYCYRLWPSLQKLPEALTAGLIAFTLVAPLLHFTLCTPLRRRIRRRRECEDRLHAQLLDYEDMLSQMKTLDSFIYICSGCKKIRNDKGSWEALEKYFIDHSDSKFSHGFCPDCAKSYMDGEGI